MRGSKRQRPSLWPDPLLVAQTRSILAGQARLLVIGLFPIVLMLLTVIIGVIVQAVRGPTRSLSDRVTTTLPAVLLIAFCFCVSVSQSIFGALICESFRVREVRGMAANNDHAALSH